MTIYYISKSGDNSNDGLSLATSKRTMFDSGADNGAYTAAIDGDSILFDDGVYVGSEIETSSGLGYMLPTIGLTFDSVNPFGATIVPSVTTAVCRITASFINMTLSFGKIILGDNSITPNYGVWFKPSAGPSTLNLGKARIFSAAFYGAHIEPANTVQLTIIDDGSDISATRGAIDAINLGSNSSVSLVKTKATITNKTVSRAAINLRATDSTVSVSILEPNITISHAVAFPLQGDFGIKVLNVDNALVYNPRLSVTTASVTGSINAVVIDCDSATLSAHRAKIIGGTLNLDANGGIGALIGHDVPSVGDNRCNFGLIRGITINGGAKFVAAIGHGVMLGNNEDGFAVSNIVNNVGIGALLKGTTRGVFNANKLTNCSSAFIQLKGCTDSRNDANEIYMDGSTGTGIAVNADGVTNNVNCSATGNIIHINSATLGKVMTVVTFQDFTAFQNIYNIINGATHTDPIASIGATNYSFIEAYIAAEEISATLVSGNIIPSTIGGSGSGLFLEVAPNINIPL